MSLDTIHLETRSKNYDKPMDKNEDHPSSGKSPSTSSPKSSSTVPLSIEKPTLDMILRHQRILFGSLSLIPMPELLNSIMCLKISLKNLV